MLNYSHLEKGATSYAVLSNRIGDSAVAKSVIQNGYSYLLYASGYETSSNSSLAAKIVTCTEDSELVRLLKSAVFWSILYSRKAFGEGVFCQTDREIVLTEMTEQSEPLFFLNHVVSPHPPYLFDANCESTMYPSRQMGNPWKDKERYVAQLQCINHRVVALIDSLPPDWWVIITSDHGPASQGTELMLNPSPELIRERHSVLMSIRAPKKIRIMKPQLPESLINIYPWLFSLISEANLFQTDDIYFSPIGAERVSLTPVPLSVVNP
jgi:hypothetical protein